MRRPRRAFLRLTAVAAAAGCTSAGATRPAQSAADDKEHAEAEVTPGEDLMQEHGLLERILLIYDEVARRIDAKAEFDIAVIASAAGIVRRFVEDYHEQQEEQFIFPRLQAAQRQTELVATLLQQHQRGRAWTDEILRRSGALPSPELARALRGFVRMYRPHAAREDTVLFPAFRELIGRDAYRELGERFEEREHQRFGEHGFERNVAEVARLEAALAIGDLSQFTEP